MSVTPKSRPHPQSKNEYKRREPVSSHTNTQFILRCKPHRPCYPRQQQCRRTPQSPLCRSLSSPPPPSRLRRQASFLAGTRRTGCGTPSPTVPATAAAAMPQNAAKSVVPRSELPSSALSTPTTGWLHRGLPAGPGVGPRRVSFLHLKSSTSQGPEEQIK